MSDSGLLPVLDQIPLEEIRSLAGGERVLGEVVASTLVELPERLAKLHQSVAACDRGAIAATAHSLSGSAAMMGLARLRAQAQALELAAPLEPEAVLLSRLAGLERELPAALAALAKQVPRALAPVPQAPPPLPAVPHVLVVDDEPHIARFVQFVLSDAGYDVAVAHSGQAAIEAVRRHRPSGIVLDLVMPGLSGLDVLGRLRVEGVEPPPTVVLTARADPATAAQASLAGAAACCTKPVAPSTLVETLAAVGVRPPTARRPGEEAASSPADGGLVAEVAAGWEALETLYDVSSVAFGTSEPAVFAEALADRFARAASGLSVALWVEGLAEGPAALAGARPERGLLREALAADGLLLLDARALERIAALEPEIEGAAAALALPLLASTGTRGALLAWRREAGLDTRLTRLAEAIVRQASAWFEAGRLREAEQERRRLSQELSLGARVQRGLLCSAPPVGLEGLRCATLWKPSLGVGGDFLDFVPLSRSRLDVLVGDVMGKGVQAALLGAAAKNHLLRSFASAAHGSVERVVQDAHQRLFDELLALESFVTLCYARLDTEAGTLSLVDAGHTRTLLLREGVCHHLCGQNAPLGVDPRERFEAVHVPLRPDDLLLFYTDGVTESRDRGGRSLGEDWLSRWLEAHGAGASPQGLLDRLWSAIEQWTGGLPQDDVTAACVRVEARQ